METKQRRASRFIIAVPCWTSSNRKTIWSISASSNLERFLLKLIFLDPVVFRILSWISSLVVSKLIRKWTVTKMESPENGRSWHGTDRLDNFPLGLGHPVISRIPFRFNAVTFLMAVQIQKWQCTFKLTDLSTRKFRNFPWIFSDVILKVPWSVPIGISMVPFKFSYEDHWVAISADQLTTIVSSTSLLVLTNNVKSEDFFSDIKRVDHATTISFSPKLWLQLVLKFFLKTFGYFSKTKIFKKKLKIFPGKKSRKFLNFQNGPLGRCNWRWRYGATISPLAIYLLRFWGVFWYASWLAINSSWT